MALKARAGAEGNDGDAGAVGVLEHGGDFIRRLRKDDDVRTMWSVIREVGRVLVEHRLAVADAPLVRHEAEQLGAQVGRHGHG